MSEPVSHRDIEDVLTSIRRLVSDNGAAEAVEETTPADSSTDDAPAASDNADRLVLTPALRVAEPVDEHSGSEDEPDTAEIEEPQDAEDAFDLRSFVPDGAVNYDSDADEHDVVEDVMEEDQPEEDHPDEGAAEEDPAEEWEDAEDDAPDHAEYQDDDEEAAVEADDTLTLEAVEEEPSFADAEEAEPETVDEDAWDMAQAEDQGPDEPDAPGDNDYAGTPVEPLQWQTRDSAPEEDLAGLAARVAGQAEAFVTEAVAQDTQDLADVSETLIDEDTLREMVTDIVRQELQGALGERITRNVRKLVRREIHRALAAHDLD